MISGEEPTIIHAHHKLTTFNLHINQAGLDLNLISMDYTLVQSSILDSSVWKMLLWISNLSPSIGNKTMTC